jgi:sporulation protein YlmC with PRC-barrel domain
MNQTTKNEPTQFIIGTEVVCNDGVLGELTRVVIDPIARTITHLVVEPRHRRGAGHLVPVELVSSAVADEITLRCTASDFSALDEAEEIHFIPGASGAWDYEQSQMLTLPYYGLGGGMGMGMGGGGMGMGMGMGGGGMGIGGGPGGGPQAVVSDLTPAGGVDVRRGEHVHATDGAIGRVQGLVVDPRNHSVTHVLLDEGHLWGKKRVAIPITAVTGVEEGVRLRLSKQEIEDLPAVSVDDPD